ncbi:hypothetical protein, partial [Enterococcus faecium]|uniref:hypothetical protein n=1 Tax=Enterococcus faecium TaxID=1352 RepID=UPI001C60F9BB
IIGNPSLNHRYRKGFYSLFKTLQQNPLALVAVYIPDLAVDYTLALVAVCILALAVDYTLALVAVCILVQEEELTAVQHLTKATSHLGQYL